MTIRLNAPAKINLCLHVLAQRPDGKHVLDSLVAFVNCGEWVELRRAAKTSLQVIGPQSANLPVNADNLVLRAAGLFPTGCDTEITLHKTMPIASGIGGGSADAAATLKAMARLWDLPLPDVTMQLDLGADVPVCMQSGLVLMQGIGEIISPLPKLPPLFACLVNPGRAVSTALIFNQLMSKTNSAIDALPGDMLQITDWLAKQRNDLQATAVLAEPMISSVLVELQAHAPIVSRMSGSGATCFALFDSLDAAQLCAQAIQAAQPNYWTTSGPLLAS